MLVTGWRTCSYSVHCSTVVTEAQLSGMSRYRDFMGTSAMSLACARGHAAVVRLLLEWGADFSGLCSVGAEWLACRVSSRRPSTENLVSDIQQGTHSAWS